MQTERFYQSLDFLPTLLIDEVLAEYDLNDPAHLREHAIVVVNHAEVLCRQFTELMPYRKVILTAALLHDTKCHIDRDLHHILGALAAHRYLQKYSELDGVFTNRDHELIERCILEHRSSWKRERATIASNAVAAADRGPFSAVGYMRRAVRFRCANLEPDTPITDFLKQRIIEDSVTHMIEKFGPNGYAWPTMPTYTMLMYSDQIEPFKKMVRYGREGLLELGNKNFSDFIR